MALLDLAEEEKRPDIHERMWQTWLGRSLARLHPKGLDTLKTAASFLHAFFDVLPFTDDASVLKGKASKESLQKRRGSFWCV